MAMIKSDRTSLLSVGPDFAMVLSMSEMLCGPSSKTRLLEKVLEPLPSATVTHTLEVALHKLNQLTSIYLVKMADRAAQGKVQHTKNLISTIV